MSMGLQKNKETFEKFWYRKKKVTPKEFLDIRIEDLVWLYAKEHKRLMKKLNKGKAGWTLKEERLFCATKWRFLGTSANFQETHPKEFKEAFKKLHRTLRDISLPPEERLKEDAWPIRLRGI